MKLLTSCSNKAGIVLLIGLFSFAGPASGSPAGTTSPPDVRLRVAVMPVENQSGATAPLDEIRASLIGSLQKQGVEVLDDTALEPFRERHRMRYTAGLDAETSKALKEELGVDAVLITVVDLYGEQAPPRVSLLSRLVATGAVPAILWFDSVGISGDDSPGLLGLTRIEDPKKMREKAVDLLFRSFARHLAGDAGIRDAERRTFRPKTAFRSPVVGTDLRENFIDFTQASSDADEGAGSVRLGVMLSSVSGRAVTVEYEVRRGTAEEGKDYALRGNVLTFNPGETVKTIELDIKDNRLHEKDRTIEVDLRNPQNALLGRVVTHTCTIMDDDAVSATDTGGRRDVSTASLPGAAFTTERQRVKRAAKTAAVTVALSAVSGEDVTIPFTVSGLPPAGDYSVTPSPVTIKAGRRSAVITVAMAGDGEADETIEVALLNPVHASLGSPRVHRLTILNRAPRPAIAVVPFVNASGKKYAGETMMLQFVKELTRLEGFTVIEPGVVRQTLLAMRIIMYDGASLPDIDLIINSLDADLILTGRVFDYQDFIASGGTPKVDFSVMLFEKTGRKVIWASKSYNQGDDGVTLFDWGNISTANALVTEMARSVRKAMVTW